MAAGEVHVLCELPTMNFEWKDVKGNDGSWSEPIECGERVSVKANQSLEIRGVSFSTDRKGRSIIVPPYVPEDDGDASCRIESNIIVVLVLSVLSVYFAR